ncbi:hypothetical protein [Desertibaculum subflavum]|uniref:hypothetical protein n=1 Tax=Desertibaculum subflavum TaxID=2268458 RepID=UPI000E661C40
MKLVALATAAMLHLAAGGAPDGHHEHEDSILKPDTPVDVGATLKGSTISVLAYRSFAPAKPAQGGLESSDRIVFQAWLREDGIARVRVLDEARNAWRAVANETWSVQGDLLCLSAGSFGMGRLCLDTLIYGQVFSAASPKADILVKGNWRKGNVHGL